MAIYFQQKQFIYITQVSIALMIAGGETHETDSMERSEGLETIRRERDKLTVNYGTTWTAKTDTPPNTGT
jgi:hypothetical protein